MREGNAYVKELHSLVTFSEVAPKEKKMVFNIQEQTTFEQDWVVLNARHKPWINLLWLGTFVLVGGFIVAIVRRVKETR